MNKKENLILAKKKVVDAGLYIATIDDIEQLASIAEDAYENHPLHNWFTNGKYNASLSKKMLWASFFISFLSFSFYLPVSTKNNILFLINELRRNLWIFLNYLIFLEK